MNSNDNTRPVSSSGLILEEDGVPLLLSAGSAVIMTDVVEHASGANRTQYARRAWMPQFSCKPIVWKEDKMPVSLAIMLKVGDDDEEEEEREIIK
jgi:ectoine hydroxylase-related dioxygenase (phytanoyl-CoA dioxygenase family)